MRQRRAFTLIELLIVVAIIAILAAIAVPNFAEAQTRAKVGRVKSDLRTLSVGLESYFIDNNSYPDIARGAPSATAFPTKGSPDYAIRVLPRLSTPITYLTQPLLPDPFGVEGVVPVYLGYANLQATEAVPDLAAVGVSGLTGEQVGAIQAHGFLILSVGPDRMDFNINSGADPDQGAERALRYLADRPAGVGLNFVYDPTNGTISVGEISRTAKGESL